MDNKQGKDEILIPGIRSHMGDWIYYICNLKMKDAATRISYAEEIHTSSCLNELIQREVSNRAKNIEKYLLEQPQHFFNALVVGVYGGEPEFVELSVNIPDHLKNNYGEVNLEGFLGYLRLKGNETLFAIDGQHRIAGIRSAVNKDKNLGDEEICVIFVGHKKDSSGLARTRRLFTTLNRYAKPVSPKDIIALDEDDVTAIITRRLLDDYSLFQDAISIKAGKNIAHTDKQNLTSIEALYSVLDFYFEYISGKSKPKWKEYKTNRPSEEEIEGYYCKAINVLDTIKESFPSLSEFEASPINDDRAEKYRNKKGGNLLFRPIGFALIIKIISYLTKELDLPEIGNLLRKIPTELSNTYWLGLLWDDKNSKMITSNNKITEVMLYYSLGGNIAQLKFTEEKLKENLAGILNKEVSQIELSKFL